MNGCVGVQVWGGSVETREENLIFHSKDYKTENMFKIENLRNYGISLLFRNIEVNKIVKYQKKKLNSLKILASQEWDYVPMI